MIFFRPMLKFPDLVPTSECGSQFTFKLEGMFKDMAVSKDLMLSYKERDIEGGVDLSVTVLTTGYWPSYPADSVIIPAQVCGYHDYVPYYFFISFFLLVTIRRMKEDLVLTNVSETW